MLRALLIATTLLAAPPLAAQGARALSASERAQGAEANPALLAEYGGRYAGPQAAYVEGVGRRVAVQSGLSTTGSDFTVALLDSPVENAFAIPGGYIYVTRQLLVLMNSEAELAAVLGHEVGHVAARHSAGRQRTSTIGSVLAGVVGAVAGSSTIGSLLGGAARTGARLYTLKYGRDQEYAADSLGVQYIARAGYTPYALADMLESLGAEQVLEARTSGREASATPAWASTHPSSAERVRRARGLAQATGRADATATQDVAFLRRLDGLLYDDNPAAGVVDGQTFRHPAMRFRFTAPTGYRIANGAQDVTVVGTGGQAQVTAGTGSDPAAAVTAQLRALGATTAQGTPETGTVNGLPVARQSLRASANGRAVDATILAYRLPATMLVVTIVTPAGSGIGPFQPMLAGLSPLSTTEAATIRPKRLRIVTVRAGDTIDTLARQMAYPDYRRERFVTLNGLADDATVTPGMLVKVVTNG